MSGANFLGKRSEVKPSTAHVLREDLVDLMRVALREAQRVGADDVPVGALLVSGRLEILSRGHNQRESLSRISGHAEIRAIEKFQKTVAKLPEQSESAGYTLVSTLQPCLMCAGAIADWRLVSRVVFGAYDSEASTVDLSSLLIDRGIEVIGGILESECAELVSDFFRRQRLR
jgi:tRNA(adenine34) deaminase